MVNQEPDFEKMTDAEIAEWQYAHKDELDADLESADEVNFEVASPLGTAVSFRLSEDEAAKIREAARRCGMSLSEWLRRTSVQSADFSPGARVGFAGPRVGSGTHRVSIPPSSSRGDATDLAALAERLKMMLDLLSERVGEVKRAEQGFEEGVTEASQVLEQFLVKAGASGGKTEG